MRWLLSSSSDRRALDVVDGTGAFDGHGPHYSSVGQEIVLVTECGRAVWACIWQKTPMARATGASRGRTGETDRKARYLWRNMMFRNLGAGLSSDLIQSALETTYREWERRYGLLPEERLRTEISLRHIRPGNPGYCYQMAGWSRGETRNGKMFLWAPERFTFSVAA